MSSHPLDASCEADASRQEMEELELQTRMERIGRKLLVLSGKGGVGKSTVAANLAMSLARAGQKVGLLDVDLHGPSVPKILGLTDRRIGPGPTGGIEPIRVTNNLSVVSVGMLLNSATDAVIWRGPMKYSVIRQFLKDVEWGQLDCLVIDSPPGTGDEPLAVAQMVGRGAQAIIVTTPQDLAVTDVRRSVSFCATLGLPVAGILENMSGLVCPHCGQMVELFGTGGGERLATETKVPFLGRIPLDPVVVTSGDTGSPFVQSDRESLAAQAFAAAFAPLLTKKQTDPSPACGAAPLPHGKPAAANEPKEKQTMKIAIPVADGRLCMHFGHCQQFALVETDQAGKSITQVEFLTPPPHEPGVLPRWLHEQGADVIIAGGMGQRAQGLFAANDITVVVGAPAEPPQDVAAAYLAGRLETGQNVCDH